MRLRLAAFPPFHKLLLAATLTTIFFSISPALAQPPTIAPAPPPSAATYLASVPLWSDIQDVATYAPKSMPDAKLILQSLAKDARYQAGHAKLKFGMNIEYVPILNNQETVYRATAMISQPSGLAFRKFMITVGASPRAVHDVQIVTDVPLSALHFDISAGLIDRMMVVEDVANEITLVFPLGVGGIDDGIVGEGHRILTPRFHGAYIETGKVIAHLSSPTYYRNEPFLPITNNRGVVTPIGFHITILDDSTWASRGGNYLVRGFESHGCMRMRQKDLRQLFTMIGSTKESKIPVNVDYFVWKRGASGARSQAMGQVDEINPYPILNSSYEGIVNFADPGEAPVYQRDPVEHLIVMSTVNRAPNLKRLSDFNADDIRELSVFDGLEKNLNR